MNEKPLRAKVAVITGAGRGIGKAIAEAYAREGAWVVCAARTKREIGQTASGIVAQGGRAVAIPADVMDERSVRRLFRAVKRKCRALDILVINAGANCDRELVENSLSGNWRKTLEVNLLGAYYCAREAVPYLKESGAGKIITVGSGLGHHGVAGRSAYACAKAGLWMLARILARELREYNISVNELIPGPVRTSIDDQAAEPARNRLRFEGEWVKEPEDVTRLALFLAAQPDVGPTAQSYSLMRRSA